MITGVKDGRKKWGREGNREVKGAGHVGKVHESGTQRHQQERKRAGECVVHGSTVMSNLTSLVVFFFFWIMDMDCMNT